MGYLHDLGNPKVKEVTERAIKQIVSAGRTCGTSPLSLEEAQHHHDLGGKQTKCGPYDNDCIIKLQSNTEAGLSNRKLDFGLCRSSYKSAPYYCIT